MKGAWPHETVADRIHAGSNLRTWIEDEIRQWAHYLDQVACDWYDNSIELYFEDSVDDFEPTSEQLGRLWDYGFSRCWLNFKGGEFKGGTERHYIHGDR